MKKCNIIIYDEINCKLEGLDASIRRKLVNKFSYELPGARFTPAVKLGRWNGMVSFFQISARTYINLLDEILPIVIDEGYDVVLDDRRKYTNFEFKKVDENTYSHISWPEGHQLAGEPVIMRPHQVDAINNYLENPQSLQEISTSAGKTIITTALSKAAEQYGRSIIIVPNRNLVNQTYEDYVNVGLDTGVFYGKDKDYTKTHTICTWQSLNSLYKKTKKGEAPIDIGEFLDGVVCVIVDEAHTCKGQVLKDLLGGTFSHIPLRWGLTGTIPKEEFEFRALQVSIGQLIGKVTAKELQDKGILSNCHIHIKQLQDQRTFSNYQSELKYLLSDPARLNQMAGMIKEITKTGNTLVLVDRVSAGKELTSILQSSALEKHAQDNIVFVSGATKSEKRKEEYDKVREADDMILVATYGVAAVGINLPRLFNIVLIEPGKSFIKVIQSIGRGLRTAKDKDFVDIYDITSSCKFAKRHLTARKRFYRESQYPHKVEKITW